MTKIINYAQELKDLKEVIDKTEVLVIKNPDNVTIKAIFNHLLKRYDKLCKNE